MRCNPAWSASTALRSRRPRRRSAASRNPATATKAASRASMPICRASSSRRANYLVSRTRRRREPGPRAPQKGAEFVAPGSRVSLRSPGTRRVVNVDQKCEPLNPDDIADLAAKRAWVCGHYDEAASDKYDTLDGKLTLLDAILRNKWIAPDETLKLQCLGVTFGDALAQNLGLTWVAVEDQYGRDPALV